MSQDAELRVEHALFVRSIFAVSPPTRVVSQMAARMHDHAFRKGEVVFEKGTTSHAVFFVVDGQVALEVDGQVAWRFEAGSTIGIGDAVLDRPHARTARALSPAHLVSIEWDDYTDILEDNYEFAKTLLETTMATIHAQSLRLAPAGVFADEDLRGADPLPVRIGAKVEAMRRLLCLRDVRAFSLAPVQPLVTLARAAEVRHWSADDVLFEAGDPAPGLLVVAAGEVEVTHPEYRATFETGAIVGAHAAIAFAAHPHRAVARTACTTLQVAKEDVYDVMEDHFGFARRLFGWLSQENERTRERLAQIAT